MREVRPYIILNGMKSTMINGLMICTLPAITKPLIRHEIEDIDGRDGDIITELGYSAYDREFDIGLYGDYSIDDVIRYFNSYGNAIFSNEPDKVYRYRIYDQIDFEKLIRFKTAKIKMHCQPFKYSAYEEAYTYEGSANSFKINNLGNIYSKPTITIYGSGLVELFINGVKVIIMSIPNGYITIDAEEMNAYSGDLYMNRFVAGDYDDLILPIGENEISWTGSVSKVVIDKYSRWI